MNNKLKITAVMTILLIASFIITPPLSNPTYAQFAQKKIFRLGYFPNINHAQALIGVGNGDFQ
jgi:NitT/TauT family transport system substrate-binding protein